MQPKDPNTAFLIELIGGFFGLLGLGYFYVGRTNDGVMRLILWILYDVIAFCAISALLAVVVGIACIPIQLVIQVGVPLWSAMMLKKQMTGEAPASSPQQYAGAPQLPPLVLPHNASDQPPYSAPDLNQPPYTPTTGATVTLQNPSASAYIVQGPNDSWTCSVCGGYVRNDAAMCKHCKASFR